MDFVKKFKEDIFSVDAANFSDMALSLFEYQSSQNLIYKQYLQTLKINPSTILKVEDIPFLPIDFFKTHEVVSGNLKINEIFESSGTTGQIRSKHYVADPEFYKVVCEAIFERFYGKLSDFSFLALLPSYAERSNSSLVYMVNHFISKSHDKQSDFYLSDHDNLIKKINTLQQKALRLKADSKNIILIGVTFALLDLCEVDNLDFSGVQVIETGGMKGRKKELIREEVHKILKDKLNMDRIGSEYGMTELLSQAYATLEGKFQAPAWMEIILRNINDPFEKGYHLKKGGINIVDFANIDSCAFIETKDLGQIVGNEEFNVLGRFDNSEVRGCNLMIV